MSMPDGMADLRARRQAAADRRGSRSLPAPKHSKPTEVAEPAAAVAAPDVLAPDQAAPPETAREGLADAAAATAAAPRAPRARPVVDAFPAAAPSRPTSRGGNLRLGQFYLDPAADDWLRSVRLAAMQRGQDVTASAVVRWALAQAAKAVTPEQVVHELVSSQPQQRAGPGRPRR